MVQLDHLGRIEVPGRLLGEAHRQHRAHREVRGHDRVGVAGFSQRANLPQPLGRDAARADDDVDAVRQAPPDSVHDDLGMGEIDRDVGRAVQGFGGSRNRDSLDRIALGRPIDGSGEVEVRGLGDGAGDMAAHAASRADHPDPDHPMAPSNALAPNGPSTVSVIGCDSTRCATRRASSSVTRLTRRRT